MIDTIIKKSVDNPFLVLGLSVLFIISGWFAFRALPIDAIPDITNVQVQIITPVPARAPDSIEANITYPIENAMNTIPGTTDIRSITRYGLSHITVIFEEGYDLYRARQLVSEQLAMIDLPEGITPSIGPISTGLGEIYHYSLEAKKWAATERGKARQMMELRSLHEWEVKPRVLSVKGVTEVNIIGGHPKEYYVRPRPKILERYGIGFSEIAKAIRESSHNTGGSFIQQTSENLLVQGSGLIRSIADIKAIPVRMLKDFTTITVGDIASVSLSKDIRTGAAVVNGEESIIGSVFMLQGANSRTVARAVDDKLQSIRKALPAWAGIKTIYNRTNLVNSTLDTVQKNLFFGALLVITILFFIMGNFRVAFITAAVIPLSLLGTFIFMKTTGIPGSLMSLGAIDFGIVIDGAVIVMDSCARMVSREAALKKRKLTRSEIRKTVTASTVEIRKAAGFGQLIIVIVFLPLFALTGIEGKMFRPMAFGFTFALVSAFLLSFTLVPSLAGLLLSGNAETKETFLIRSIKSMYRPLLEKAMTWKKSVLGAAFLLVLSAAGLFLHTGGEFIPRLDEGAIAVQFLRPVNISTERAIELEKMSQNIIRQFPEVRDVFCRLGSAEITVDPAGVNHGDTFVTLKPRHEWPPIDGKQRDIDSLRKEIYRTLRESVPGQRIMMSQPIELRFNELLEGVRSDIAMKIFGEDMKLLEKKGRVAVQILRSIEGAGEVEPEIKGKSPLLRIVPRMKTLKQYGIPKNQVLDTVKIAMGGERAGHLYEGVRKYPIVVRLPEYLRRDIHALEQIPVGISPEYTVPIGEVARLKIDDIYSSITREGGKRRTAVMINISGRDIESFVSEAKKKIEAHLSLPEGYYIKWGGNFENLYAAKEKLFILVPVTLLAVFFLIYSAFGSIKLTALIFLGIPFAVVGGIVNMKIMGLPFSVSAGIGFIALFGIAVLNGLVLVSYFDRLKEDGLEKEERARQGAMLRLRPVMMTALTDILGFLPMMLAAGTGAEVQKPLAAVVVGGVITSTLLTLIVLPVFYQIIERE